MVEGAIDGWVKCFHPGFLAPREREYHSMGAYRIFQVEIKPLKILWISAIPTAVAKKIHLCRQSVIPSKIKSPQEAERNTSVSGRL